jgi:hypothetical protein
MVRVTRDTAGCWPSEVRFGKTAIDQAPGASRRPTADGVPGLDRHANSGSGTAGDWRGGTRSPRPAPVGAPDDVASVCITGSCSSSIVQFQDHVRAWGRQHAADSSRSRGSPHRSRTPESLQSATCQASQPVICRVLVQVNARRDGERRIDEPVDRVASVQPTAPGGSALQRLRLLFGHANHGQLRNERRSALSCRVPRPPPLAGHSTLPSSSCTVRRSPARAGQYDAR